MEPLCGTLRNLAEPKLLRMEPVYAEPRGTWCKVSGNHPEALSEEPQAFQAVGEQNCVHCVGVKKSVAFFGARAIGANLIRLSRIFGGLKRFDAI